MFFLGVLFYWYSKNPLIDVYYMMRNLAMGTASLIFFFYLYKLLKKEKKEEKNRLMKDLKTNKKKLFQQIRNLVKWKEMSREDFEDTLDRINGYTEEEIQAKYR